MLCFRDLYHHSQCSVILLNTLRWLLTFQAWSRSSSSIWAGLLPVCATGERSGWFLQLRLLLHPVSSGTPSGWRHRPPRGWRLQSPSDGAAAFALRGRSILLHGEAGEISGLHLRKSSQNGAQLLHYRDFKCLHLVSRISHSAHPPMQTCVLWLLAHPGCSAPVLSYNILMMYPTGSLSAWNMQYPTAPSSFRTALGCTYN